MCTYSLNTHTCTHTGMFVLTDHYETRYVWFLFVCLRVYLKLKQKTVIGLECTATQCSRWWWCVGGGVLKVVCLWWWCVDGGGLMVVC